MGGLYDIGLKKKILRVTGSSNESERDLSMRLPEEREVSVLEMVNGCRLLAFIVFKQNQGQYMTI